MDITRCAEIAAHLAHFPPANHAEVVARFGLRWRDWEAAAAHWAKERDAELAAGKTQISSRFVHDLVTTAERLKERQAPMESIGPLPFSFRLEATPHAEPGGRDAAASAAPAVEANQVLAGARDLDAPSFWDSGSEPIAPLSSMPHSVARYLAETAAVSGPVAPLKMPFASAPGAPDQALSRAMAHAEAVQGPRSQQRPPASGGTVAVSESASGQPLPPGVPTMTMEQYTSLRVELQLLPEHTTAVLARYAVRPDDQEALFAHWRKRFEADPPLRMMFARGYAHYLAWFRENPAALESLAQSVRGGQPR